MTYPEAIDWLYSTQAFGIKLGLENPTRLLREYHAVPQPATQVIQVAGTNGKGSTCAFIDALAQAHGTRTGLFTSPHLVSYRERIQALGQEMPEAAIAQGLTSLRALVAHWEHHPTFFELTLALAMRYFCEQGCQLIILEVGMGGRYDATTAVPADVTVLTPIDLDHQQWLGDTLAAIAEEKSAIFRAERPALSATQAPEAAAVVEQTAHQKRAPLTWITAPLQGYSLGLLGQHQASNAALALAALQQAGYQLNDDSIRQGLSQARHPGRFEILPPQAVAEGADPADEKKEGPTFIFDIAHNPHATQSLAANLREHFPHVKPQLIFGAAGSKEIAPMLATLSPVVADIHFTSINSPRSTPTDDLLAALPLAAQASAQQHPNFSSALASALSSAPQENLILITGSAFLVGEAKAQLSAKTHRASSQ